MADYNRKKQYGNAENRSFRAERPKRDVRQRRERDDSSEPDAGIIAGRNPVIEALKADRPMNAVYVCGEGGSLGLICRMAAERGIVVKKTTEVKLDEMTDGAAHQGVAASGACAEYVTVEDILAVSAKKGTKPFIIICDEIEDPHNLGAIIRTAEAAGADGIIIPKRRSAALNVTVFKTSAGAASRLPVARVANIPAALDLLKENGVWIFGTDAEGEDYTEADFCGGTGLVIGSEGNGMGRLVREKCDFLASLPMMGEITSLNASVAAGIFMYEAVRQRRNNIRG